ncbi:efflux RND transporter periplasmic adaptor subunit [Pontibacter sp. Tf4]|uniref:efflux RND transporter periplasmic adaptor subunit n=1 Tax=Pontibacter sp. Tf4 TaxID=2761620 RepID=UPI001626F03A|nr:efflux RND transporter periplasmic adaptor subunit [Pontibacter sp. Tf4]MBB6609713.1 efflux RND transporter periplasmic adaptor subunit [Pontibacter sp. Tf4]
MAVLLIALSACSGKKNEEHSSHHEHSGKTEEEAYLATIAQSTNKYVISDQKTVKVGAVTGESEFSGTGYIRSDERRNVKVAARFEGRIEDLHVKYNYAYVRKGQPIMELYSPTLNTMQQELRYLRQYPEDAALLEQARQRLRLLGLSNKQVREIETSKIPKSKVEIESPAEGFVLFSDATAKPAARMQGTNQGNGMGSMGEETASLNTAQSAEGSRPGVLRKGNYVKAGQTLFEVNDYREVWALLSVDARHQSQLRAGAPVKVYSEREPARYTTGKIDLIEPVFEPGQKFVTVRVYLPNKDLHFKENALVRAMIASGSKEVLTVPNTALLDLGRKKVVWLLTGKTPQGKKIFEAIEVKTGSITANATEVISGLKEGQEIASDAGLLADSESMINAAALKE